MSKDEKIDKFSDLLSSFQYAAETAEWPDERNARDNMFSELMEMYREALTSDT